MNEERIRLLLEEESSSSNYDDEIASEVENGSPAEEETRNFEDEIQSSDRENDSQSESEDYDTNGDHYIGKDSRTRWNKTPGSSQVRRCTRNLGTQLPGPKGEAKNTKEPLEIWRLFFSESVCTWIVQWTNKEINRLKCN
ncbi:hypothetical protein RR46_14789 [Papilio xuthus]|uniref:Uncharacterized protein n=1 Tax=Papilio xuthus TaxID=66420 RepID=A0A194PJM3_PAPXU|nr:hypothetical protein RR46_14789 [Papilio xuthus]